MKNYINLIKRAFYNSVFADTYKDEILESLKSKISMATYLSIRGVIEQEAISRKEKGVSENRICGNEIIVTLTSYGKRIHDVYLVVESIMRQTLKPNRIVLWLDETEFSIKDLPLSLQKQKQFGLEIYFVENLRSYKKLFFALKKYPESCLITIDDDVIYPIDLIERLVSSYMQNPDMVSCISARLMERNEELGTWKNYNEFPFPIVDHDIISDLLIPEGFGGILYPPHCFHSDVLNKERFLNLAPTTDDLWFKAMSLKKGTQVKLLRSIRPLYNYLTINQEVQDMALHVTNVQNNQNSVQFKKLFDYYSLFEQLDITKKK